MRLKLSIPPSPTSSSTSPAERAEQMRLLSCFCAARSSALAAPAAPAGLAAAADVLRRAAAAPSVLRGAVLLSFWLLGRAERRGARAAAERRQAACGGVGEAIRAAQARGHATAVIAADYALILTPPSNEVIATEEQSACLWHDRTPSCEGLLNAERCVVSVSKLTWHHACGAHHMKVQAPLHNRCIVLN
jgi:hypothetical protein